MSKWYYSDYERNRHGPVGRDDIAELHHTGQLDPETLVWREGLPQWQPWRTLVGEVMLDGARPALAGASFASATSEAPAHARASPYTIAEPRSPYAPPRAPLLRDAGLHPGGEIVYAGFWKRVAANLIDSLVIAVLGMVIGAAIGGLIGAAFGIGGGLGKGGITVIQLVVQLATIALTACYYGCFYASVQQATPGKMAIGIKVVRSNSEGSGFWRGFMRYFAMIASGLILGIGFLMAGFTERKQALHDMICDTVVVDKWAFTELPHRQREELGTVAAVVLALGGLAFFGLAALVFVGLRAFAQTAH